MQLADPRVVVDRFLIGVFFFAHDVVEEQDARGGGAAGFEENGLG